MGKRKAPDQRAKSNQHHERSRTFLLNDGDVSEKRMKFYETLTTAKKQAAISVIYANTETHAKILVQFKNQVSLDTVGPIFAYNKESEIKDKKWPAFKACTLNEAIKVFRETTNVVTFGAEIHLWDRHKRQRRAAAPPELGLV